jgi:hypothetical protein
MGIGDGTVREGDEDRETLEALRELEKLDPWLARALIRAILAGSWNGLDKLLQRMHGFSTTESDEHLKTG